MSLLILFYFGIVSFSVYILWSEALQKFYVGSTNNLSNRIKRHNSGYEKFTAKGKPWELIPSIECVDRKEAYNLEMKIKGRGIHRWLNDQGILNQK